MKSERTSTGIQAGCLSLAMSNLWEKEEAMEYASDIDMTLVICTTSSLTLIVLGILVCTVFSERFRERSKAPSKWCSRSSRERSRDYWGSVVSCPSCGSYCRICCLWA